MQTHNNNGKCSYGIEKFEGTFDKEEIGVTIIPTRTINDIRNPEALGVYVYLLARPTGWKLNVKQLKEHFQCGQDKMYRILNWLLKETFIVCTRVRHKGQYTKPNYRVLLHRLSESNRNIDITSPALKNEDSIEFSPYPENTDTVKADAEKTETYKTENINNIDNKNTPIVPKGTACVFFAMFWSLYPIKKGRKQCQDKWKRLNFDEKADQILLALKNQLAHDEQWKRGYIPNPLTYLNGELWNDEIVLAKNNIAKERKVVYI